MDIIASSDPIFSEKGWEASEDYSKLYAWNNPEKQTRKSADPAGEDLERSMRRARSKLRRIALSNDFRWFVTLTLDPAKVDSHSGEAVVKKLNAWCSNMVQRKGLKYILVPERHKSGRIHFHGFLRIVHRLLHHGIVRCLHSGKFLFGLGALFGRHGCEHRFHLFLLLFEVTFHLFLVKHAHHSPFR